MLPLLLALLAGRTLRKPLAGGRAALAAAATGVLAGIAVAVKVTFAGPVAGLAVGLRYVVTGRHRTAVLAAGIAGGAIVLAAGYAVAGPAAWKSLSQRLSSAHDSFLPLPGAVYLHPAAYAGVTLAPVLGDIVQYPWYDAMFFPLLALLPASRLDGWLVARITVISGLLLPGIGITTAQYREVRVVVPVFTV